MPTTSGGHPTRRAASLLDLDPDLGQFLDERRAAEAQRRLTVTVHRLGTGAWKTAPLTAADPGHIGLLVVDGVLAREVLASDVVSTELLGPGEVLRPWHLTPASSLLRVTVRWSVLAESRVAVLDRRLASQLVEYPEIYSVLIDRLNARAQRLAVAQAISQLNRVDRRLLTLFWHLAERWGRITPGGVHLPLTLSHRMLSQLIGARRPTVSTALGELAGRDEVVRLPDGTWMLKGEPVGAPDDQTARFVPPRRRFLPAAAEAAPAVRDAPPPPRRRSAEEAVAGSADLRARLRAVRSDYERIAAELSQAQATTQELYLRATQLREGRPPVRAAPPTPASAA